MHKDFFEVRYILLNCRDIRSHTINITYIRCSVTVDACPSIALLNRIDCRIDARMTSTVMIFLHDASQFRTQGNL